MYQVTKTTKSSIYVTICGKTGTSHKCKISTRSEFLDAISWINGNTEVVELLKVCRTVLDAATVKELKSFYAPTKKQKTQTATRKKERENWFAKNKKKLDRMENEMAAQPGFLGGVIRADAVGVVDTEVMKKLYTR